MVLVRGIRGDLKLHPGIKLWGSVLAVTFVLGGVTYLKFADFTDEMAECEALDGFWVGSVPVRLGSQATNGGHCLIMDADEAGEQTKAIEAGGDAAPLIVTIDGAAE
jgi:hypothetical protein